MSPALIAAFSLQHRQNILPRALMTALHAAARACRWSIATIDWETYPMSFGWTAVRGAADVQAVLVVRDTNLVALSGTQPEYRNLRFVDNAAFEEAARPVASDLHLLSRSLLATSLTAADREYLRAFGPHVAANLTYWKPETVADVLFNWWD